MQWATVRCSGSSRFPPHEGQVSFFIRNPLSYLTIISGAKLLPRLFCQTRWCCSAQPLRSANQTPASHLAHAVYAAVKLLQGLRIGKPELAKDATDYCPCSTSAARAVHNHACPLAGLPVYQVRCCEGPRCSLVSGFVGFRPWTQVLKICRVEFAKRIWVVSENTRSSSKLLV